MNNRIEWIDALKGFAILTVVIGHCADGILSAGMYSQYKFELQALHDAIYSFHMPLFFIVSGFVFWLSKSYNKYKSKVFNFVIVYLIWDFLTWLGKFLIGAKVNKQVGFEELFGIFYHPIPPMWYLYVLIIFYLFFSVLNVKKVTFPVVALCGIVAIASKMLSFNIGVANQLLYHAYFFVMGGYIVQTKLYMKLKRHQVYLICLVLGVNIYLYFNHVGIAACVNVFKVFVVANLASLICFYAVSKIKVYEVLKVMGENTLQIYVIHCFVTAGLRLVFKVAGINSLFLYMIVGTILGVVIPLVITKICTHIYYLNFAFQPTKTIQYIKQKKYYIN